MRDERPSRANSTTTPGPTFAEPAIAARETRRRRIEIDKFARHTLLPAEAFSNDLAGEEDFLRLCDPDTPRGPQAEAVRRRIMSSCAGWASRPTPKEFHAAVRAEHPTRRQRAIVWMWGLEATTRELLEAWLQRAYTLRQLVNALHLANFDCGSRIRVINQWATKF